MSLLSQFIGQSSWSRSFLPFILSACRRSSAFRGTNGQLHVFISLSLASQPPHDVIASVLNFLREVAQPMPRSPRPLFANERQLERLHSKCIVRNASGTGLGSVKSGSGRNPCAPPSPDSIKRRCRADGTPNPRIRGQFPG